jgi:hypothetical protein
MREASAGSPARPCAVRSEGSIGAAGSLRALRSISCWGAAETADAGSNDSARGAGLGVCIRGACGRGCAACIDGADVEEEFANACDGKPGAGGPLRRRPRPPRRPRRRFFLLVASLASATAAAPCDSAPDDGADSSSVSSAESSPETSPSANCACGSGASSECSFARLDAGSAAL